MLGEEIWAVYVNGQKYKGDLNKRQAEAIAERYQRGFCKHKDFRDYVEIKKDQDVVKQVNEMYKEAKAGNPQKYMFVEWRDD